MAGCDAPEVFETAEHALDGIAIAVERGREAVFFHLQLALGGMFGIVPRCSTCRRIASAS